MNFIQQLINQKVNELTPSELIKYANMYNIKLTSQEAKKIVQILREEDKIDIHDHKQHRKIIQKVAKKVDPTLAKKANQLLKQFTNMM